MQNLCKLFFLLAIVGNSFGQTSDFESAFDAGNSLNANFGLTTVDGNTFVGLRVQPEFSLGKLGLGLDVPLLFDIESGEVRTDEFESGVGVLRMVRFLRYGVKKKDPVFVKFGDMTGESLGFGALVGNYSNAISFEKRKVGVSADILIKKMVGVELIYSDLNFDGSMKMLAVRPYVKPLGSTPIPIINTLEVGVSFVSDNDASSQVVDGVETTTYTSDGINAFGADIGLNFVKTKMFTLTGDVQYSKLSKNDAFAADNATTGYDAGEGFSVGVETKFRFIANTVFMNARIERQWYGENYIPQFFNFAYEINKDARLRELLTAEKSQGIYGTLSAEVLQLVKIGGSLLLPDDLDKDNPSRGAIVGLDLQTKEIASFKARGTYVKAGLNDLGDAFKLDERSLVNLIVTRTLGKFFEVGVDYQWTFAADENGDFKAVNQVRPYVGMSLKF